MEVLSMAGSRPPHEDAPMDLSTASSRLRHHPQLPLMMHDDPWRALAEGRTPQLPFTTLDPVVAKTPPQIPPSSRYIPIPKKRHCMARASTPTSTSVCSPSLNFASSTARYSPPSASDCTAFSSLPPESARKRARLDTSDPVPSKLAYELRGQRSLSFLADQKNSTSVITSITSSKSYKSSSSKNYSNSNKQNYKGLGLGEESGGRGMEEKVAISGSVSQLAMRPRQKHQPSSDAGSSAGASGSSFSGLGLGGLGLAGGDEGGGSDLNSPGNHHLLTAFMQLQAASQAQTEILPSSAVKDTEALLAAVRQSQLLYYTYCSQLIQNIRAKQLQQHQPILHPHSHPQSRSPPESRLEYDVEERQTSHEDLLSSKSPADFEEDVKEEESLDATEDEDHLAGLNSILRMRLNTQESLDSQLSPAGSPCGNLPSSTTGGEDLDYSPSEASSGKARKRAPRALTGKHVRPGTGASATTLLTLRQKLQERQKYREQYGTDPPSASKGKSKTRKR